MFGRLFEKFVVLLVVLALLSAAAHFMVSVLQRVGCGLGTLLPAVARSVLWTGVTGVFVIGLFVRGRRWLAQHDPEAWRRARAQEQRARVAPRPPAEDVPTALPLPTLPEDPDPALPFGEEAEE